ncbi:MAG: 16S rRNA (cytidine(1402)-2'-O)-methyltransferase [Xanthomonadales bacterium]|nr:16S rRNA (cytidine(1402)-2'-O)-methyltransferase [Xanthomonadales bacterium]
METDNKTRNEGEINSAQTSSGVLWVVATPIGNLGDISQRAIEILRQVDLVAAEDTRHSRRLFDAYQINTKLVAYHEHNERKQAARLLEQLLAGKQIALISDAGTPLISDPGYHLLKLATAAGIDCRPVPGASAVIAALSVSGLPSERFCFAGFLPPKTAARKNSFEQCIGNKQTMIFYESSHRIQACLQDVLEVLGNERELVICRELTKTFETTLRGTAEELLEIVSTNPNQRKGEFVLLLGPDKNQPEGLEVSSATRELFQLLCEELPASRAAKLAAKISGESRQAIFALK